MDKYTEPHFSNSALITIDTQNDFTLDDAPAYIPGTKEVIPNMTHLLDVFRKNKLPVIHIIRLYNTDGSNVELCRKQIIEDGTAMVAPGSKGAELVEALKPDSSVALNSDELLSGDLQQIGNNEYVLYKPRWGAFYNTRLEQFLREKGVDTLMFCGCNYPNCPRTSIYEASERDFRVVLVKDAISQLYPKGEDEMNNIGVNLMTTSYIEKVLS